MKHIMKNLGLFLLVATVAGVAMAVATACQKDPSTRRGGEPEFADMKFTVSIPDDHITGLNTRATARDSRIEAVDVLVFDDTDGFVELSKAENITFNVENTAVGMSEYTFTVILSTSRKPRRIFFVTNNVLDPVTGLPRVVYPTLTEGMSAEMVWSNTHTRSLSQSGLQANGESYLPLVMWGGTRLPKISADQHITGDVTLLRTTAALKVQKALSSGGDLDRLEINRYCMVYTSSEARVAPSGWENWDNDHSGPEYDPMDPISPPALIVDHSGNVGGNAYWTDYTGEHLHYFNEGVSVKTCIIIEAEYDGELCFYKLLPKDINGVTIPFFARNHKYVVNIVAVHGMGYPTLEEAIEAPIYNNEQITAMLDEHDELRVFTSDGVSYIGASHNSVIVLKGQDARVGQKNRDLVKIYSYPSPPQVSFTGRGLNGGVTLSAQDPLTGLYTITGNTLNTTDNPQSGIITVTAGNVTLTISTLVYGITLGLPPIATPQWVVSSPLWISDDTHWSYRLKEGSRNFYLSTTTSTAGLGEEHKVGTGGTNWGKYGLVSVTDKTPLPENEVYMVFYGGNTYLQEPETNGFEGYLDVCRIENDGRMYLSNWVFDGSGNN